MATRLLQLDDLRQVQSPDKIASLFHKLGYNAKSSELDVRDLELPARSTEAVCSSYLIANQGKEELQVLLFHLHPQEFSSPSVASNRMRAIANSLCRRPSNFLLLGTGDYNQLMLVNPRKSFDERMNLKVGIRKLLIDRTNPTNYDRDRLEAIAVSNKKPQELYQAQCEAFDVEKLTKQFFKGYKGLFDRVQQVIKEYNNHSYFENEDRLHQFSQRLLGRIMFLYFLQKKEFLAGDRTFLTTQYRKLKLDAEDTDYYINVLEPLFFETLNEYRPDMKSAWGKIPYLNGGLFNRDYGKDVEDAAGLDTPEQIEIPNSLFDPGDSKSVLNFFNSYNFTVAENVEGDEDVAVDPEMLGKVFENMLEVEERGKSGTFYTPRGIVHFMCSEVLSRYLSDETGMNLETVKKIIDFDPEQPANYFKELISPQQAFVLKLALQSLKCLDPAVGSAAFPMGMMQVILAAYQSIAEREGNPIKRGSLAMSRLKRNIIANNLYGVDIKPEAIEIAKLRMWLSLVVDIPDIDDVEPLPNLEYKLMCGDSLISTINGEVLIPDPVTNQDAVQLQLEVTPIQQAIQPLLELQQQYFDVQIDERAQLKKQILEAETNIFKVAIAERRSFWESEQSKLNKTISKKGKLTKNIEKKKTTIAAQISELDELSTDVENRKRSLSFFQYYLHFRDVFEVKDGFDVVIGNPPFGAKLSQKEKSVVKKLYSDVHVRSIETSNYFISLSLRLIKNSGYLIFIVPNNFLYQDEFRKTRKLLVDDNILLGTIDLGENVFEAIISSCIFWVNKKKNQDYKLRFANLRKYTKKDIFNELKSIDNKFETYPKQEFLRSPSLNFGINIKSQTLINKMLSNCPTSISDIANNVSYGVCTGGNNIFVVSEDICQKNKFESDLLKDVILGKDILPYVVNYKTNQKLIYTTKNISIEKYPHIYQYLQSFKEKLSKKRETKKGVLPYWCLHWARNINLFESNKIVMRQTGDSIIASIDTSNTYTLDSVLIITLNNNSFVSYPFLLGVLNSQIIQFFYQQVTQEQGRVFAQVKPKNIRKIPIPNVSKAEIVAIETLVEKCFSSPKNEIQQWKTEIDNKLAHLYNLTTKEMELIKNELR